MYNLFVDWKILAVIIFSIAFSIAAVVALRLLHLSRFVWLAQKQIAGSMQMFDAAYQILFESLPPFCFVFFGVGRGAWAFRGVAFGTALICLAKGAPPVSNQQTRAKRQQITFRDTCIPNTNKKPEKYRELNCQLQQYVGEIEIELHLHFMLKIHQMTATAHGAR